MALRVGDKAPDFSLVAHDGSTVNLKDFAQKKAVVLFFYPKDDSPGCTIEACDFRDHNSRFAAAGAEVIGVSADSSDSHERFAKKHDLTMTLVSDPGAKTAQAYGVKSLFGLLPGRVTFVIDCQGVIRYVFDSQLRAGAHAGKALEIVKELVAQDTPVTIL